MRVKKSRNRTGPLLRKSIKTILRIVSILSVLLLGLSYLSSSISPSTFWPLHFLGIAYPWLLLLNIIFLFFWLFLKKWHGILPLFCILLGWGHLTTFVGMHPGSSEGNIQVMTYNVGLKKKMKYKERKVLMGKIRKAYINKENDIVCLQEITPDERSFQMVLKEAKKQGLKYYHRIPNTALTILSRYPIIKSGKLSFHGRGNGAIYADIKVKEKKLRIYNLHLASNKVTAKTNNLIQTGNLQEKSTWAEIKDVLQRVKGKSMVRAELAEEVRKHIDASPYPTIVCGDYNETPQSYAYHRIKGTHQAAFRAGGFGLGSTYAGRIPALKIDHILVDEALFVSDAAVIHTDLGDHYPVVAEIDW